MIALVEGASRQKTPNEIALTILLAAFTLIFVIVCVVDYRYNYFFIYNQFFKRIIIIIIINVNNNNYNLTYTPPWCTYVIELSSIDLAPCEGGTCMHGGLVVSSAPHSPDMQAYPGACKPTEIPAGGVVRHSSLVDVRSHP